MDRISTLTPYSCLIGTRIDFLNHTVKTTDFLGITQTQCSQSYLQQDVAYYAVHFNKRVCGIKNLDCNALQGIKPKFLIMED